MLRSLALFALMLPVIVGCSSGEPSKPKDEGQATASDGKGTKDKNWKLNGSNSADKGDEKASESDDEPSTLAEDRSRKSLEGNWILLILQQVPQREGRLVAEFPFALMGIKPGAEEPVEMVQSPSELPFKLAFKGGKVEKDSVDFDLEGPNETIFNFQGRFEKGAVIGNVSAGTNVFPARLSATKSKSLEGVEPIPAAHVEEFKQAWESNDVVKGILAFAKKRPTSPLVLDGYERILHAAKLEKFTAEQVREYVEDFRKASAQWGPRMEVMGLFRSAVVLTNSEIYPEYALELVERVEKDLKSTGPEFLGDSVAQAREVLERKIHLDGAVKLLASENDEDQKKGRAELDELLQKDRFNAFALYELARDAEKKERTDEAIDFYSRLAAWPSLENELQATWAQSEEERPLPRETLAKLWKEKNGNTDGIDAFLDDVYRTKLYAFAGDKAAAREGEGPQKVALVELFTGAQCPPCVAADVALGGIEWVFERRDVVTLRYHQHIPRADQLANDDSEARFYYYQGRGTPMVVVDGKPVSEVGGYLQHASRAFKNLREAVDKSLEQKSTVALSLKAEAKEGRISLSVAAEGLPEDTSELKLRMVLAEAEIPFVAPNGVRVHEFVVRSMPATPQGVSVPADGKALYNGTVKLSDFRQRLTEYLAAYEEQNPDVEFKVKPLALDKLYFVAIIQNDRTREVLQTAMIPVAGTIEYTPEKAPKPPATSPEPPATEKKPDEKKPEEKKPDETKADEARPEKSEKKADE